MIGLIEYTGYTAKPTFRVYQKELQLPNRKYKLLATFVWKSDALKFAEEKHLKHYNKTKVMLKNRNIKVLI